MQIFDKNLIVVSFYFHIRSPEKKHIRYNCSINQALNDNQYTCWFKKEKKVL